MKDKKFWTKALRKAFWAKVDRTAGRNSCWLWLGTKSDRGYGRFKYKGKRYTAHRLALAIYEDIPLPPPNIEAGHFCPDGDNPSCVHPYHLKWLTSKEHGEDRAEKQQMHPPSGDDHWTHQHPENVPRGETSARRLHPERWEHLKGEGHWTHQQPEKVARGEEHGSRTHPENMRRGDNHPRRLHPESYAHLKGEGHWTKTHPEIKPAEGAKNPGAKLTESRVRKIRELGAKGWTRKQLADKFAVTGVTIWEILTRRKWQHLP